jgi:hypothetical protein
MSVRWERWRRDLLFALVGVVVASAVLVPVGWAYYRAERQRTEAAEVRIEAPEQKLEQERERERAERRALEAAKIATDHLTPGERYDRRVRERERNGSFRRDDWWKGGASDPATEWYEDTAKPRP